MKLDSRDLIDRAQETINGLNDLILAMIEAPTLPTASEFHAFRVLCESASNDLAEAVAIDKDNEA